MVDEAASVAGYSVSYIYKLLARDRIEGVKRGGAWFIDLGSLMEHKQKMNNLGSDKYIQWRHGQ